MAEEGMDEEQPRRRLRTARLEAFSDGIFTIAGTLLVLEIAVPPGATRLLHAIFEQWPSYLGYLASFATIGAIWLAHSVITEYLERADLWLMRLNLLLMLAVAFLPFPTRLLAEYIREGNSERVATTFYGLSLLATSALLSLFWRYAVHRGLVRRDADEGDVQVLTERLTPGLIGYVVMIVLGLFVPVAAVVGYLAVAVYYLVPLGIGRAGRRRHDRRSRKAPP
ncbi:TMEM175 family protein [Streptomyces sp. NPDC059176]|uniref:TMEM175 family protein n=1 Tax=unclassified Streptomyces TaxID=2593676 RepID=UPI00367B6619